MRSQHTKASAARQATIIVLTIFVIFSALELAYRFPGIAAPLEKLELSARDTLMRTGRSPVPNPDIVIVDIDDQSLSWVGERWPWSRSRMAGIVDWLNDAGAAVIAYDILLFDPSTDPEDDLALAQAFEEANAAVTVSQLFEIPFSTTYNIPAPAFLPVLDGYGLTEVARDDDAVVRGVIGYKEFQDEVIYNWSFQIVSAYLDIPGPQDPSLGQLTFNGSTVPLNNRGWILTRFAGPPSTYNTYPAAYLMEGDYDPELFAGKIVLIGSSSETLQDIYPTPYSATNLTPGVEVVANVVDTLLSGDYLKLTPPWMALLILFGLAVLARLIALISRPVVSVSSMAAGMLLYLLVAVLFLNRTGLILPIISPLLVLLLGVVAPTLGEAITQEIEKRRVRNMFSRFIAPQVVDQLLQSQDISSLNKRTKLTILFSDIRGFTTLSERMSPEEVVSLLNPYLAAMTAIIHRHGGTVDKYEGDAIIAFFGEPIPYPDHALRAVRAAVEMQHELERLNREWQQAGVYTGTLEMGIGLNTGEVFVGLLGSEQRINYTVIGDAANLAARLQEKTKELGHSILISGDTQRQIEGHIPAEFVQSTPIRGRSQEVEVWRVTD